MKALVTGANGFIGRSLSSRLAHDNEVIGIYHKKKPVNRTNIVWEQADLTNYHLIAAICKKYCPAVVVHCAGLAHQKIGAVGGETYMRVNSQATANLARAASDGNPAVRFIFLSSVSVYGEGPQINPQITPEEWSPYSTGQAQITQNKKDASRKGAKAQKRKKNGNDGVGENGDCEPSSDYACSKLDAERCLTDLSNEGMIRDLVILRLAPVYDRNWTLNLDRRVLAPLNLAYIRFGSGLQKISALARPNLVDFIHFLCHRSASTPRIDILNVCDEEAYEFNKVIRVFKNSKIRPNRPVISVSLPVVWFATRIAGSLLPDKKKWIHSCYGKLASSLVFDNEKMLKTGFKPVHSLETIFPSADSAD
jgi:nucleoside-diphosphate-sugar epimerase